MGKNMSDNKANNSIAKRCFILLLALMLLTFTFCSALVYYVDPFFHYHAPLPGFP